MAVAWGQGWQGMAGMAGDGRDGRDGRGWHVVWDRVVRQQFIAAASRGRGRKTHLSWL